MVWDVTAGNGMAIGASNRASNSTSLFAAAPGAASANPEEPSQKGFTNGSFKQPSLNVKPKLCGINRFWAVTSVLCGVQAVALEHRLQAAMRFQ
jgi:hypothetical protein